MDAAEIVMHVVNGNHRDVVFDFLGEGVCQSSKAAHRHPHSEILPFYVAGRNVTGIRIADDPLALAANAFTGAINLDSLAGKVAKGLVHVGNTNVPKFYQEFRNRVLGSSGHSDGGTNRISLNKSGDYLSSLVRGETIHTDYYNSAQASCQVKNDAGIKFFYPSEFSAVDNA